MPETPDSMADPTDTGTSPSIQQERKKVPRFYASYPRLFYNGLQEPVVHSSWTATMNLK